VSELPQEQAFEKVIQTLLKSNLDEKNTVDSPQKDPMDSSSQQQFYSKVKFCILYLNSQIQEIKDRMSKI
jgi:DNA repair protein RadC